MRRTTRSVVVSLLVAVAVVLGGRMALAQQLQPGDLGVVEAPTAGAVTISLGDIPIPILHTAEVAFKKYMGGGSVTSAQVDKDDVLAVYEIVGTAGGRRVEADIRADGVLVELEIQIGQGQVPEAVTQALATYAPGFEPAAEQPRIEKSVRPSDGGLPEIWYEFSGTSFDVEIRSDGKAVLIEPA
jgi:hypothetical protein